MKTLKISWLILLSLSTILFVSSCTKEKDLNFIDVVPHKTDLNTVLENRERFAESFSEAINNQIFYEFIVDELVFAKKEGELLYAGIYNRKIPKLGKSVSEFLTTTESSINTDLRSIDDETDFFGEVSTATDPLLTLVLMPGDGNELNELELLEQPEKVYVDKIFEEFEIGEDIAFCRNGRKFFEPYGKEPRDPYFALKLNETHIAYDIDTEVVFYNEPGTLTSCGAYVRYEDVKSPQARIAKIGNTIIADKEYDSTSGGTTVDPRGCDEDCERDCTNGKDAISAIWFDHDFEGWPRGGPEFIMQYALGIRSSTTSNSHGFVLQQSAGRNGYTAKGDENVWYSKDQKDFAYIKKQLFEWNKDIHTADMVELWTEDDGKFQNYNVSANLSATVGAVTGGVGISTTFSAGDDEVGQVIVQYCDDNNYTYVISHSSGNVQFKQLDRGY